MAGNISKHFYVAAATKTCRDFVHPNLTCGEATRKALLDGVKGSLMFYFPACFVSTQLVTADNFLLIDY